MEKQKFSIRKYAVGAVSVVIAVLLLWGGSVLLNQNKTNDSNQPKQQVEQEKPKETINQESTTNNATPVEKEQERQQETNRVEEVKEETKTVSQIGVSQVVENPNNTTSTDAPSKVGETTEQQLPQIANVVVEKKLEYSNAYPSHNVIEEQIQYDKTKLTTYNEVVDNGQLELVRDVIEVVYENGVEKERNLVRKEVVQNARPKLITVGTIVETTQTVDGETFETDFQEKHIEVEDLLVNQTEEQFQGEKGQSKKVYDIVYHDGVEVSKKERIVVLSEPKPKVIAHGVKEIKTTTEKVTVEKETEINEDESMLVSATPIITRQGENGEKEVTTTKTFIRGVEVDSKVTEKELKPMVKEQKTIGVLEYKEREVVEPITIETVYEKDTNMFDGDERLIEDGEAGERINTYTDKIIRGKTVESTLKGTQDVKPMKPRRMATGSIIRTFERTPVEQPIEITTKYVESEDMLVTDPQVEQFEGEAGIREVTTIVEKWDGVVKNTTTEEREVKPMKQRIVLVGVKRVEVSQSEEPIEITENVTLDENKLANTDDEVTFVGEQGVNTVTTTKTFIRDELKSTDVQKTVKTPMKQKEVKRGTKVVTPNAKTVTRTIKYVDSLNQELGREVQTVNLDKTTWTNKSDVVWGSGAFESIPPKTFEKYETTETIPTVEVNGNTGNQELVIHYQNKVETTISNKDYEVNYVTKNGNIVNIELVVDKSIQVVTKTDLVTGKQIVEEKLEPSVFDDMYKTVYNIVSVNTSKNKNGGLKNLLIQDNQIFVEITKNENYNFDTLLDEIFIDSEEVRYQKAIKELDIYPQFELTQEQVMKLSQRLDHSKFEQYTLELVNQARRENNANDLVLNQHLTKGSQTRADEQALIGDLRSIDENQDGRGDKPHTRPDGTSFRTVFDNTVVNENTTGENIAFNMSFRITDFASEKHLAELIFKQFMESEGHRRNLLKPEYISAGFTFQFGAENQYYDNDEGQVVIGVQIFSTENPQ